MQQQHDRPRSLVCRFRNLPGPAGFTLLAIPLVAAVGALGLPVLASPASIHTANLAATLPGTRVPLTGSVPGATSSTPTTAARPQVAAVRADGHAPAPVHRQARPVTAADAPADGTPASAPSAAKALRAYFRAGYGYDDAVLLARLWSRGTTPYDAKVRAGSKLVHHQPVPVTPGQNAWSVSRDLALEAYTNNGYGYDEAVRLAAAWQSPTANGGIFDVKVRAGRKILAAIELPVLSPTAPTAQQAVQAYLNAGYGYDEAVLLSRLWAQGTTPYDAKVRAGRELLQFAQPPVSPGDTAWTVSSEIALEAYFDNGYGYDEAVRLAKLWHAPTPQGDLTDVKVTAGRKVLAGIHLPAA